jgi:hypothetical protein
MRKAATVVAEVSSSFWMAVRDSVSDVDDFEIGDSLT